MNKALWQASKGKFKRVIKKYRCLHCGFEVLASFDPEECFKCGKVSEIKESILKQGEHK